MRLTAVYFTGVGLLGSWGCASELTKDSLTGKALLASQLRLSAHCNAPNATKEGLVEMRVLLQNTTGREVVFSKASTSSRNGFGDLLQVHVFRNDVPAWDPPALSERWPYSAEEFVVSLRHKREKRKLAPAEVRVVADRFQYRLPRPGRYRLWFTLFLPYDGPDAVGTHWGGNPGVMLRSNTVEFDYE